MRTRRPFSIDREQEAAYEGSGLGAGRMCGVEGRSGLGHQGVGPPEGEERVDTAQRPPVGPAEVLQWRVAAQVVRRIGSHQAPGASLAKLKEMGLYLALGGAVASEGILQQGSEPHQGDYEGGPAAALDRRGEARLRGEWDRRD